MKSSRRKTAAALLSALALTLSLLTGCSLQPHEKKLPVKVLILPKFEVGEMTGDFPGEAQYFYEAWLEGGDVYETEGCPEKGRLYYKDGIALSLAGQGKVASAINTCAVLSDTRFDFSGSYILSVGCGGAAEGYGIFGDVYVISAAADFDLGHRADPREMKDPASPTWFHDESFDESAFIYLDPDLTGRVFALTENIPLQTTDLTLRFLKKEYPNEAWAGRPPRVMRGTSLTSDNFWKGRFDHQNALLIAKTYHCPDPYAVTEMEDLAVCQAVKRFGMLERLIILRAAVNMDVFPSGVSPEMLWGSEVPDHLASKGSMESVDIFETAMQNLFSAGKAVIDAVLNGSL